MVHTIGNLVIHAFEVGLPVFCAIHFQDTKYLRRKIIENIPQIRSNETQG
jgi:hypothetical protein